MRWPSVSSPLSRYDDLQREADDAEGERLTRWRMCCPRQAENERGARPDAETMVCCEYQRLPRRLILNQLQHTEHRNVIAAEHVTAGRDVLVCNVIDGMCHHGRMVRGRGYAIPAARIRDADEKRKYPKPQNAGSEESAMAMQWTRHDFFDVNGSV